MKRLDRVCGESKRDDGNRVPFWVALDIFVEPGAAGAGVFSAVSPIRGARATGQTRTERYCDRNAAPPRWD